MTDQNQDTQANGAVDPNAPVFAPQAVYVKDVSFEAPNGPRAPANGENPTINLNLNTAVNDLAPDLKEVVLTVNVQALIQDKPMWLVEVQQAGAFAVRNVPQEEMGRLMGIFCPNYLLPYARQTVSDLLLKGGFPPFLVPPVNFDQLFAQAVLQQQQRAAQASAN